MKTIAIVSGGMDSVTLAYYLKSQGHDLHLVSFNYNQRHKKEIDFAIQNAVLLEVPHSIVDLSTVGAFLKGSSLTDNIDVPDGHYAEDSMRITVVPNRNAIMLAIAYGIAVAEKADAVAIGNHAGDHFIYPDCRPEFVDSFRIMQNIAIGDFGSVDLLAPFTSITKANIVSIGTEINVPYALTWSCYKGKQHHCGQCGTCVERKEAFELAHVEDPTVYRPD